MSRKQGWDSALAEVTLPSGETITVHRHRRCSYSERPAAAIPNGDHAICAGCHHKLRRT